MTAARRAIEVFGAPPVPLADAATVLEFSPVANNAAGAAVPWGLSAVLEELPAGSTCVRFAQPGWASVFSGDHSEMRPAYEAVPYTPDAVSEAVAAASGRPLIMVVRDLHRHAWMASAADAVAAARPDVTVVEMGVPYGVDEKSVGATLIATHGAARVSGLAAAEALTGRAPGSAGPAPAR